MAFDAEIEGLAAKVDAARKRSLTERLRRFVEMDKVSAYRRLFLDEHGKPKPDAVTVIADFCKVAGIGFVDMPFHSDAQLRDRAAQRRLALHILGRLDLSGERLRDLARKTMEKTK